MSPVSRGRKAKSKTKTKKRASGPPSSARLDPSDLLVRARLSAFEGTQSLMGPPERPGWFDASIKNVLDQAGVVMAAHGPRELEQAAAELVGAELYRTVHDERHGVWFDWLFEELADAAAGRVKEEADRQDEAWQAPWRLLYGLTSIGSPPLRSSAQRALTEARKGLPAGAAKQPDWLRLLPKIAATGQVFEMHDAYGTRFAVIAGFCYPGGTDPSVFLFDIDACGFVRLARAGVFDDVEQAATAWRAQLGGGARGARPSPVETAERLYCLVHLDEEEGLLDGSEPRAVMDNWFRANRRSQDLADSLRKRGMPLPEAKSLYDDIDTVPTEEAFASWYLGRHGRPPDLDAVGALAEEWLEGALPGTWHAASPHRARFQLNLISDWIPGRVTVGAKALLPEWVRWNGEQSGLSGPLLDDAVAAASGDPQPSGDCAEAIS